MSLFSSDPPVSSNNTDTSLSSESLLAMTAPADSDPTINIRRFKVTATITVAMFLKEVGYIYIWYRFESRDIVNSLLVLSFPINIKVLQYEKKVARQNSLHNIHIFQIH